MSVIDPEQEGHRLADEYSRMLDGELEALALDFASLTTSAQVALTNDVSRRGLAVQSASEPHSDNDTSPEREGQHVVRRFSDLPEATIAQSKLSSAGIDSFIADEFVLSANAYLSPVLGGARLIVNQSDAEAADEILREPILSEFDDE